MGRRHQEALASSDLRKRKPTVPCLARTTSKGQDTHPGEWAALQPSLTMGGANVGRLTDGARPHRGLCLSREVRLLLWPTISRGRIGLALRRTSRFLLALVYSNVSLWQERSPHPGKKRRPKHIFRFLPPASIWYSLQHMSSQGAHQQDSRTPVLRGDGVPIQAPAAGLIWLVGLSHATNHLVMLIFPSVLLLVQREFALSYVELGILANGGLLCYGLGALPAGMLA